VLASAGSAIGTLVCAPGIDRPAPPALAAPRPSGSVPVRLISMGGVSPLKGLDDALDALALVPSASWEWTIVGDLGVAPEHAQSLRRRAEQRGLAARVHLIGQRDHAQALALLGQSDALIVSSYTENTPLVALEALGLGVPVVGYAVGGVPDLVSDEAAGLLAPLLDVSALGARLARVIGDPVERARLAQGAARAGRALWNWDAAAQHFAAALASELTRREPGLLDPAARPPAGA
jgi:glycosyltransferase involved in cell wall biosynthesis